MNDNFEKKITMLIENQQGDLHRLEELLERSKNGKKIYNSDKLHIKDLYYKKSN